MACFFTFYSFKGGVGRSMAMANVADILARRGLRVLAIDFDLEAPGLERYFQVEKTAALANPGLIDLLQSFKKCLSGNAPLDDSAEFRQLERFIFPIFQQPLDNGGTLHLMTAGQREPAAQYHQYALAVRTFDWQDFYDNWEGQTFFKWLRSQLSDVGHRGQPYDVVLVDSRTGVTEMGGVCTYLLADAIVMLCAANHQNVEGTRDVALDFRSEAVRKLRKDAHLDLVIVPARIEQDDPALLEKFFERFGNFFQKDEPAAFNEAELSFRELTIPYQPEFAFEEIVVSDPLRREERRRIGNAFELLANALTLLARSDEKLASQREHALTAIRSQLGRASADTVRVEPAQATHFDPTLRFAGYDVFLPAGQVDQDAVAAIAHALRAADISVFIDPSALTPGNRVAEATSLALHHSRHLLICAGSLGVSSWQKQEIGLARSSNQPIRILPLLLPGAQHDIFSLSLRGVADLQVADLRRWPDDTAAFPLLVQALRGAGRKSGEAEARGLPAINPYAGLDTYDEGRVPLIEVPSELIATLTRHLQESGLCLFIGATGVGKSSVVAALVAALRQSRSKAGAPLHTLHLKLGQPGALERLADAPAGQLLVVDDWDHRPAGLLPPGQEPLWPRQLLERIAAASPNKPVLLVGHDLPLAAWRCAPSPDADLWARLQPVSCVMPTPDDATVRRAISTPATRSGFAFEPGLLDRITQDAGRGPSALPRAPEVGARPWGPATPGPLALPAYDACGGIIKVFAAHLDERLGRIPAGLEEAVNALLLRMAVLAEDGQLSWQCVTWETARSQPALGRNGAEALLWLIGERIVNAWRTRPDELRISLLLAPAGAQRLTALIDGHKDDLIRRRRLDTSLAVWLDRQRRPDALLSGYRLDDASRLFERWGAQLNADEQAYIQLSRQSAAALTRKRWILSAVALSIVIGAFAFQTWNESRATREAAAAAATKAAEAAAEAGRQATPATTKAATTVLDAISREGARPTDYGLDAALFKGVRIYPQYRDSRDKEMVGALSLTMGSTGARIEAAEWLADIKTCGEVRFFHPDDRPRAEALAQATARNLKLLGYAFELDTLDLSGSSMAKRNPGTLELWLPPLHSLARSGPPPATNLADGAELREVPGNCALLGSNKDQREALAMKLGTAYLKLFDGELPMRQAWLDGFLMYRHEVTVEQFARFASACQPGSGLACPEGWQATGKPREPARFLGWAQADAYCRWAGARLPSEDEWEKAARGHDGRIWPWGDEADPKRFQGAETSSNKDVAEVGSKPAGDSPYGIADMAGNVWEFTSTAQPGEQHIMKGGAYPSPLMEARSASRATSQDKNRGTPYQGFRCAIDLPAAKPDK